MPRSQELTDDSIAPLPPQLDSADGKLVYLYLAAADGATVDDLNRTLEMRKLSVLSVLESLSRQGLVEKTGPEYAPTSAAH